MMLLLQFITVFSNCMNSKCISGVASFVTQRALMTEPADVGLDMLLDRVSQLGAVMALGTLPHCFT